MATNEFSIMGAVHKRAASWRRDLWLTLLRTAPYFPRNRVGRAIRYAIVKATRNAPLELAIARGDTVVQVGAVGKGELWNMVRLVGPKGRVIAIEPAPDNIEAIEERLQTEGIANVTVVRKGAWSERGTQTLYMHPKFSGSHIVLESGSKHDRALAPHEYAAALEIDVDRLDDIFLEYGIKTVDFIKITVMGAEMQVLKGMDRLLSTVPSLWVKAHALVDGEPANRAIAKLLRGRGFRTVVTRGNLGPDLRERPGDVYATRH